MTPATPTPRTDAAVLRHQTLTAPHDLIPSFADHARQLERELAQERAKVGRLRAALKYVYHEIGLSAYGADDEHDEKVQAFWVMAEQALRETEEKP